MTALAKTESVENLPLAAPTQNNPMLEMLAEAIRANQPIEVIREIKAMVKEIAADEADRAFNAAFAAFKGEIIEVRRNREVTDGPLRGRRYAELVSFVDAATPALSKHGLSASWSISKDEKDWIEVTCTIEHSLGGRKQVSLGGPPDTGGAKNALQARISTVTYLERATFKAACGLAEQGDDDDGAGGETAGEAVSSEQLAKIRELIDATNSDVAKFCAYFKIEALPDLPVKHYQRAIDSLNAKVKK